MAETVRITNDKTMMDTKTKKDLICNLEEIPNYKSKHNMLNGIVNQLSGTVQSDIASIRTHMVPYRKSK